jgi:hypothetical protein
MKTAYASLIVLALAACASTPPSNAPDSRANWAAYRTELAQERDSGTLTPLQAEDKLEARYRELYGQDPTMEGAFAYRRELYAQADLGNVSMPEAKALAKARLDEVIARRDAQSEFHEWMARRFPAEPSD